MLVPRTQLCPWRDRKCYKTRKMYAGNLLLVASNWWNTEERHAIAGREKRSMGRKFRLCFEQIITSFPFEADPALYSLHNNFLF